MMNPTDPNNERPSSHLHSEHDAPRRDETIVSCTRTIVMRGPRWWVESTLKKSIGPEGVGSLGPGRSIVETSRSEVTLCE